MKRRSLLALGAALVAAALPAAASAVMLWTLVGTPLVITAWQSTTFTLTATNLDVLTELGCLEVDLPGSFVIESLGTPTASNGDAWVSNSSGTTVIVRSLSGGGRLELLETVQFTIRAHATVAGAFLWPNHAHRRQDCSGADQIGVALSVTVLPAPLPTPTPAPTATPAPSLPLPSLPLPSIGLPTPPPEPSPTATESATPEPSRPAPSDESGAGGDPPPGGDGGDGLAALGLRLARLTGEAGADTDVGVELFGLLDADFVWFVPAASVALPGLLVILWVILQAIGALAWIPAVRRMADEDGKRERSPV